MVPIPTGVRPVLQAKVTTPGNWQQVTSFRVLTTTPGETRFKTEAHAFITKYNLYIRFEICVHKTEHLPNSKQ